MITALERRTPDRLPVTTHHVMPSFLRRYMGGASVQEFFDRFGFDPVRWTVAFDCDESKGEYYDPTHTQIGFLEGRRICSDDWQFKVEDVSGQEYATQRFNVITPKKTLSMVLQSNEHTTWVSEHLIKGKSDIEIIARYATAPKCDVAAVNSVAEQESCRGLIRGHVCTFDGFGQPGCWQDLACLYGTENVIMATFDDPAWVHTALKVLQERKKVYINSLHGARYDLIELGGGSASTTVISPSIFHEYVAPYDAELIALAHEARQRIVYHTCGGMMPILEDIAAMKPDAMETFTPAAIAGDVDLAAAKSRIGDKVCMIGGFDQFHFLTGCSPRETREEVRRCFREAGEGGGYILSPSDHFFDADLQLIEAFVDEARTCFYS